MSDQPDELAALCDRAVALSRSLSGPLRRIAVRRGDAAVEVDWSEPAAPAAATAPAAPAARPDAGPDGVLAAPAGMTTMTQVVEDEDVHTVAAPLVGTFYVAPSPGEEPFVTVGSPVAVGQTLGIVEAMKLLNPIVSEVEGHVVEVLVGDAQAVEFEQPLVRVALTPAGPGPVAVATPLTVAG